MIDIYTLLETLKKKTQVAYPPELLKPRRAAFVRQLERKTGHVTAHPVGSKPIDCVRKAA